MGSRRIGRFLAARERVQRARDDARWIAHVQAVVTEQCEAIHAELAALEASVSTLNESIDCD